MKTITPAMRAHLQSETLTIAMCYLFKRKDETYFAFTAFEEDILFDLGQALSDQGINSPAWIAVQHLYYQSTPSVSGMDLQGGSDMSTNTTSLVGPMNSTLVSAAITESDVKAGLWDSARWAAFMVNYMDLTMGVVPIATGRVGRITPQSERGMFGVELNGLTQALQTVFGRLYTASCTWTLGTLNNDGSPSNCTKDLTAFTFAGTIEGLNGDNLTIYDSSLTQDSGTSVVNIVDVTNANPGVVTVDDASSLYETEPVIISGVIGPALVNMVTTIKNLDKVANTFELLLDTSDTATYPAYVSDGIVTPLGGASSYFAGGTVKFDPAPDGGANAGRTMDVKASAVGQATLQLPLPYAMSLGDKYTIKAGCDKTYATCKTKFSNGINHGGFDKIVGVDAYVQPINN